MPKTIGRIIFLMGCICAIMFSPVAAQYYNYDVGVTAIISPPDLMQPDVAYPIEVEITNFGRYDVTFGAFFRCYNIRSMDFVLGDTMYTTLNAGDIDTLTFDGSLAVHDEHDGFMINANTWLSGDQYPVNDTLISYSLYGGQSPVLVWYGNLDAKPVESYINNEIPVDVYFQGPLDGNAVGELCLALGADTRYIDELLGSESGSINFPLSEWDVAYFTDQVGSPPNPDGWISQSVRAVANSTPPYDNPWLRAITPIKLFSTAIHTVFDTSLLGRTVAGLGPGLDSQYGPSYCDDTTGQRCNVYEIFSPLYFPDISWCDYSPGDIGGGGGTPIGSDITYGVNYFRGVGGPPPDSCINPQNGEWLYVAGDVNGDCQFICSDITYLVRYFMGIQPVLRYCPYTPPLNQQ